MKLRNLIIIAATWLLTAPVFADIVRLDNVTGAWTGALPPGCCLIDNSSNGITNPIMIRWGNESVKSGYDFTFVDPPIDLATGSPPTPQLIGTFVHLNFPITGTPLGSVELDITADVSISTDGGITFADKGTRNFAFDFKHTETPNSPPCPVGDATQNTPPCADLVKVTPAANSETFMIGNVQYTLDIAGFSQDGGNTIASQFITVENQRNTAGLYGVVQRTTIQVPEPASLALLGLGVLAAGFVRRRSSR